MESVYQLNITATHTTSTVPLSMSRQAGGEGYGTILTSHSDQVRHF